VEKSAPAQQTLTPPSETNNHGHGLIINPSSEFSKTPAAKHYPAASRAWLLQSEKQFRKNACNGCRKNCPTRRGPLPLS
jgi:hypothetical protein